MADPKLRIGVEIDSASAIRGLLESKRALAGLEAEVGKARDRANQLAAAMRAGGGAEAGRAFEAARREAARLKDALQAQRTQIETTRRSLAGAGVDVSRLASEYRRLRAESAGAGGGAAAPEVDRMRTKVRETSAAVDELKRSLAGLVGLGAIKSFVGAAVTETNRAESAFRGLEAVANGTGVGIGAAMAAASRLSADGLLDVASASAALQNLLSRGYNIEQAEQTLVRLKDAAAFNRASHLSLSEAVVTATDGLRNENSVLVDNAGVTKNVSKIWEEYAATIGKSVKDLTDQEKILAEVEGIQRETAFQTGNAAKAAAGFQGAQAKLNASLTEFRVAVGDALTPVLTSLANAGVAVVRNFLTPFLAGVQKAGALVGFLGRSVAVLLTESFGSIPQRLREAKKAYDETLASINASGPSFARGVTGGADPAKAAAFRARLSGGSSSDKAEKAEKSTKAKSTRTAATAKPADLTDERLAVDRAALDAAARLEADAIDRVRERYRTAFDQRLIDARSFYDADARLQQQAIDARLAALEQERVAVDARSRNPAGTESDRLRAAAEVKKLDADIAIARRARGQVEVQSAEAATRAERELSASLVQVRLDLAQLRGAADPEALRASLTDANRALLEQLRAAGNGAGEAQVLQLIDARVVGEQMRAVEDEITRSLERLRVAEDSINVQINAGLLTEAQGRDRIVTLHRQTADEVDKLIPRMVQLSAASGDPRAVTRVAELRNRVAELRATTSEFVLRLRGGAESVATSFFTDLLGQADSVNDAFDNLGRNFVRMLNQMVAEALAKRVILSMFGGFLGLGAAPVGKAAGGLVTGPGTGTSDSIPARLSNGEFVIRASAVREWGVGFLSAINRGIAPPTVSGGRLGFAAGGLVPAMPAASGGGDVHVSMTVNATDAASFRRSQSQIAADLARSIKRGGRSA